MIAYDDSSRAAVLLRRCSSSFSTNSSKSLNGLKILCTTEAPIAVQNSPVTTTRKNTSPGTPLTAIIESTWEKKEIQVEIHMKFALENLF